MLTDRHIQAALKAAHSRRLSDGAGKGTGRLVLHIRPANGRAVAEWYIQQIKDGKRRLKKIGTYPQMTLLDARNKFEEDYSALIAEGKNIKTSKTRKTGSIGELFADYIAYLKKEKKTHKDPERILTRAAKSFGETRKANEITTDEVIDFIAPIYERGAKSQADHVRGNIRAAFSWAIRNQNDYRKRNAERIYNLKANPADSIPVEKKGKGQRFLEVDEIRALIKWIDSYQPAKGKRAIPNSTLQCVKLALIVGQRVTEIATLHTSQYNRLRGCLEWDDTKNERAHVLPLPKQARAILDALEPNEHGWFFPAYFDPSKSIGFNRLQQVTRAYVLKTKCTPFAPRDFRRTFKTLGGFAGISKTDRDRLQNHVFGDISSRHYDRYDYFEEKCAAIRKWEEWLEANIFNEPERKVIRIAV